MTPDQLAELAARLKRLSSDYAFMNAYPGAAAAMVNAADLIAGMAQRTNEQDILDVLDWENLRNGAIRALNPANQWAFDRLAQRVPLSDEQIDKALQTAPHAILVLADRSQLTTSAFKDVLRRLARTIEQAHGIRSEK